MCLATGSWRKEIYVPYVTVGGKPIFIINSAGTWIVYRPFFYGPLRSLYKRCVETKKDEFLTLEKYVGRRVDVQYSDAYPHGAENWCVSTLLVAIKSAGNNRVKQQCDALWSR